MPANTPSPTAEDFTTMLGMVTGGFVSQITAAFAELNIAHHLSGKPQPAAYVAEQEHADAAATYRLLRAGVTLGLVTHTAGEFAATPLLGTLLPGAPHSLGHLARAWAAPGHWQPWGAFTQVVRSGSAQVESALGCSIFEYFTKNVDEGMLFSKAVTDLSTPVIAEAVPVLDVRATRTVADLGGANGAFVLSLMAAHPHLRGSVVELPHAVPDARAEAERRGLAERFSAVEGDFFEEVPSADLYLLKFILHDWSDEENVRLLRNCRDSLTPGGRLAIVEIVLGEAADPGIGALMDLTMMTMLPGRERSLAEFDALLADAGLRRSKLTHLQAPYAVIEAQAV
ncbi:methyltransferase [Amycolatopsis rhabdoformis]|uniref:Methyltransferase n=1 Tax=Amycolatopsis rhabdoformis TaxID=1448059 RepID=A0ABZ1IK58_9PSEU|nr:methyltransferase [Amycolatopsis rhabdoformis]WSE34633.1 methyltransferase [Amycolatopsis rhabdoformis]